MDVGRRSDPRSLDLGVAASFSVLEGIDGDIIPIERGGGTCRRPLDAS